MLKMPVGLYEKALPPELSWEERLAAAGQAGYDFIDISIDESDERLAALGLDSSERAALRQCYRQYRRARLNHVPQCSSQIPTGQPRSCNSPAGAGNHVQGDRVCC